MKRRVAVEPVIDHVKAEHRIDRNYIHLEMKHRAAVEPVTISRRRIAYHNHQSHSGGDVDRVTPALADVGYNASLLFLRRAQSVYLCLDHSAPSAPN